LTANGHITAGTTLYDLGYRGRAVCVRASVVSPMLEGPLSRLWPQRTANLLLTFHAQHTRDARYVTVAIPCGAWTQTVKD
jgi:hypothetical protein